MGRESLSAHEKALVHAISAMATKAVLRDDVRLVSLTAALVAAVKGLSVAASLLFDSLPHSSVSQEFVLKREALHESIKVLVNDIKNGNFKGDEKDAKSLLLIQLKKISLAAKGVIDSVGENFPPTTPPSDTLPEEDLVQEEEPLKCPRCQQPIDKGGDHLVYAGTPWHPKCFVCWECTQPLGGKEFLLIGGKPICPSCSPKCAKCLLPVTKDGVSALRKYFHASCFKCEGCQTVLNNHTRLYQKGGMPCCAQCISRNSVFDHLRSPNKLSVLEEEDEQPRESQVGGTTETPGGENAMLLEKNGRNERVEMVEGAENNQRSRDERDGKDEREGKDEKDEEPRSTSSSFSQENQGEAPSPTPKSPIGPPPNPRCLHGVLTREEGVTFLIQFCVEDYSVEKIFFWLDVDQYKVVDVSQEELVMYSKNIYRKYIHPEAELKLILPDPIKREIEEATESSTVDRQTFNRAQALVYQDLEKDVFPRFFYSLAGRKYLAKVLEEERKNLRSSKLGALRIRANTLLSKLEKQLPNPEARTSKEETARLRSSSNLVDESTTVDITNFEKRYGKQKFYVYEIQVSRKEPDKESAIENMFLYRRYSQFLDLHMCLEQCFPEEIFPPFPPKIFIGRSHVKSVTISRMQDLDYYIKGLLSMKKDISQSQVVSDFFKPTEEDLSNFWFNKRLSQTSSNFASKYH